MSEDKRKPSEAAMDVHDAAKAEAGGQVVRWADRAMYEAEEMPFDVQTGPRVTLLNATPKPLQAIAAMGAIYEGRVVRDLDDVTREQAQRYFNDLNATKLKAPFEAVSLHFMIEGVTRSFTHQMVRQRTAVFAQESLRFAVKEDVGEDTALPPSLAGLAPDDPRVIIWKRAVNGVDDAYHALVDNGVPAEDARGLLPHNITTRLHYVTNLRALLDHGGNRLCTQAQFEWRAVWDQIIRAMANYSTPDRGDVLFPETSTVDGWQFAEMAKIFRPVCYLTGKCEFKASFDRACKIRDRVEQNHAVGRPSSEWHLPHDVRGDDQGRRFVGIPAIHPAEWMLDHGAARERG